MNVICMLKQAVWECSFTCMVSPSLLVGHIWGVFYTAHKRLPKMTMWFYTVFFFFFFFLSNKTCYIVNITKMNIHFSVCWLKKTENKWFDDLVSLMYYVRYLCLDLPTFILDGCRATTQASRYRPSNLVNQTFSYCNATLISFNRSNDRCYYRHGLSINPRLNTGGALYLSQLMTDACLSIMVDEDQFKYSIYICNIILKLIYL